jgi:putative transposase
LLWSFRILIASRSALIAENLFLRKQLAFFQERKRRPHGITPSSRLILIALANLFDWRDALVVVKPGTFIKWHRTAFRWLWRWKSRKRGRPPFPKTSVS